MFELQVGGVYKFRELASGVIKMLALPISNGGVERIFSDVKTLKSPKRSLLGNEMLSSLLYCKHGLEYMGKMVQTFIPPDDMLAGNAYTTSTLYDRPN